MAQGRLDFHAWSPGLSNPGHCPGLYSVHCGKNTQVNTGGSAPVTQIPRLLTLVTGNLDSQACLWDQYFPL